MLLLVDWNYKGKGRACCIQASKFRCGRCLLIVLCLIFTVYCLPPLFVEWDLNPMFTLRASSHNVPACLRAACISWHFCFLFSGWFLFDIVPIICLPLCVRACGLHLLALLQTTARKLEIFGDTWTSNLVTFGQWTKEENILTTWQTKGKVLASGPINVNLLAILQTMKGKDLHQLRRPTGMLKIFGDTF